MAFRSVPTPNPYSLLYRIPEGSQCQNFLPPGMTCSVPKRGMSDVHPLTESLFEQYETEVKEVFMTEKTVTVTFHRHVRLTEEIDWGIGNLLHQFVAFVAVSEPLPPVNRYAALRDDLQIAEGDSEVVQCIKELLQNRIRPMLQDDGGDVKFHKFDERSGEVCVSLLGACRSCPSSPQTLKDGIERTLQHFLPEVKSVREIGGGAGGGEDYEFVHSSSESVMREWSDTDVARVRRLKRGTTADGLLTEDELSDPALINDDDDDGDEGDEHPPV